MYEAEAEIDLALDCKLFCYSHECRSSMNTSGQGNVVVVEHNESRRLQSERPKGITAKYTRFADEIPTNCQHC